MALALMGIEASSGRSGMTTGTKLLGYTWQGGDFFPRSPCPEKKKKTQQGFCLSRLQLGGRAGGSYFTVWARAG